MHRRVGAGALDQAEHRPASASTIENASASAERSRHARRGMSRGRPRRSRSASAAAPGPARRARAPRHRGSSTSVSVSGASYAAARTCPARTRGFAWSRIAASTRRPSSLSGSRMKNWSSASSDATSTASPCRAGRRGPTAGAATRPCPGSRPRSRVEQADVDPQLERVRGADAEQVALAEPPLDLAPLCRRVAGAVRREVRVVAEPLGGEAVDQLGRLAALRERERPQAALDEQRLELRGLGERRAAQAELVVEQRRVPEDDGALGPRRRVVADRPSRGRRAARRRARPGSRSSPRRAGTAGRRRRCARAAAAAAGRSRRASRTRRGTRAPRRRRRSAGSRARRPSGRGSAARRCGACPGS